MVYILDKIELDLCFAFTRGAGTFQMMGIPLPLSMLSLTYNQFSRLVKASKKAVLEDIESTNPYIFCPYGGSSRLSGLTELPSNTGMVVGPLLSGIVSDVLGYLYTCAV